ncbi:MAG: hypothetical protein B6D71_08870 [gamma proteobacterium symbiont of Stewartia floridana]|nr:MAG: hypothetical protein B6D71_08870 [gamma proteobacterium symbiont of Stewartia floridana]
MSTAFYIALEKDDVEFDTFVNGKAIADVADDLNELCESNNIKAIDDFLSQDPSEFLDDFELPDDFEIKWYEAQEGLDYFTSLIGLINANDCNFNKEEVVSDLNEYLDVLQKVKAANLKWHLELDI